MTSIEDMHAIARRFFAASSNGDWTTAAALVSEDAQAWQNVGGVERRFHDVIPYLQKLAKVMGPWRYENVRVMASPEGFCEQHQVVFEGSDERLSQSVDVCVIALVNAAGLIIRIDEYLDSAAM